jgi:hypothetical protein
MRKTDPPCIPLRSALRVILDDVLRRSEPEAFKLVLDFEAAFEWDVLDDGQLSSVG